LGHSVLQETVLNVYKKNILFFLRYFSFFDKRLKDERLNKKIIKNVEKRRIFMNVYNYIICNKKITIFTNFM